MKDQKEEEAIRQEEEAIRLRLLIRAGICVDCGKEPAAPDRVICESCYAAHQDLLSKSILGYVTWP